MKWSRSAFPRSTSGASSAGPECRAGPIHGLLFLAYVAMAWDLRAAQRWDARRFAVVLVAAVLPTGPFWLHKSLKK